MKYHHYPDWETDPRFIYLGSEKNPNTGLGYDYYLHTDPDYRGGMRSYTYRHGTEPPDYGSGPLRDTCTLADARTFVAWSKHHAQDYTFGWHRSQWFALVYLALGITPLITADLDA